MAVAIMFPLLGGLFFIVNNEKLIPSLIFVLIGTLVSFILYVCYLLKKDVYFYQLALGFFSWGASFGFGSWLVFTTVVSGSLIKIIPFYMTFSFSALIFAVYSVSLFLKYHIDFKKHEGFYLEGLDFSTGIIDPLKTRFFNSKIDQKEIAHSPFFLPIKVFLFFAIPIGGAGCAVLMRHIGESSRLIILALAMYSLSIMSIIGGMPGFYSIFALAKLQIRHRKWFVLKTDKKPVK
jgi:hypothetical protein